MLARASYLAGERASLDASMERLVGLQRRIPVGTRNVEMCFPTSTPCRTLEPKKFPVPGPGLLDPVSCGPPVASQGFRVRQDPSIARLATTKQAWKTL